MLTSKFYVILGKMAGFNAKVTFFYFCIYRPKIRFFSFQSITFMTYGRLVNISIEILFRLGHFSNITNRNKIIGKNLLAV